MEFFELSLSNTNVVTCGIGQLKGPLVAISLCKLWLYWLSMLSHMYHLCRTKCLFQADWPTTVYFSLFGQPLVAKPSRRDIVLHINSTHRLPIILLV